MNDQKLSNATTNRSILGRGLLGLGLVMTLGAVSGGGAEIWLSPIAAALGGRIHNIGGYSGGPTFRPVSEAFDPAGGTLLHEHRKH